MINEVKSYLLAVLLVSQLACVLRMIYAKDMKKTLVTERMLHPLDSYTAYNFHEGEWAYNIPVMALSPGWMCWGIRDWWTTELDLECWLGGVLSFNFRFAVISQDGIRPSIAYETMYQYLPDEINLLEGYDSLNIVRKGNSWYNRFNASWFLLRRLHVHLSAGCTYSEYLLIENDNRPFYYGKEYLDSVSPDISFSIDWRMSTWLSFHATGSYGTTFVYLDNVPRKYQFTYGVRVAPLAHSRLGFFNSFRVELAAIAFHFSEAQETVTMPVPVFPYIYWQWRG